MSRRRGSRGGRRKNKEARAAQVSEGAQGFDEKRARLNKRLSEKAIRQAYARFAANEGASNSRFFGDWNAASGSADENLLEDLPLLRDRSSELFRNDGLARNAIKTQVENVVGRGLKPQLAPDHKELGITKKQAQDFAKKVNSAYPYWATGADAAGKTDFVGMQQLALAQILIKGDVASHSIMVGEPGRRFESAIELISADRIETPYALATNSHIRGGVEQTQTGRATHYHVRRAHPGDSSLSSLSEEFDRIAARDMYGRPSFMLHFIPEEPGQSRGRPCLAPVMTTLQMRRSTLFAEMVAAKASACISLIVESNFAEGQIGTQVTTDKGGMVEDLEPGTMQYLSPGEKVTDFTPTRPNGALKDFIRMLDRSVGLGVGISYHSIVRDSSDSNFASSRADILSDRRMYKCLQTFLMRSFCQPHYENFIEELFLKGELPWIKTVEDFYQRRSSWCKTEWIADGWDWVDPTKDIKAAAAAIESKLDSRTRIAAERGVDIKKIAEDLETEKELFGEELEPLEKPKPVTDAKSKEGPADSQAEDVKEAAGVRD